MSQISLVFPIFNEEAVLPFLIERLDTVISGLESSGETIEAIFVNDGSRDRSYALLCELAPSRPWMRLIQLSRNFGHQIAVTAGMQHATGDAVVLLDADLQDPPELLPEMIRLWREEKYDVVYGVRRTRAGETKFKLWSAALFYRGLRQLTNVDIPADTGDFRLMSRPVVDALNAMGEQHRFLRGMAAWVGYRQYGLPYDRDARGRGRDQVPVPEDVQARHGRRDGVLARPAEARNESRRRHRGVFRSSTASSRSSGGTSSPARFSRAGPR